MLNMILKIIMKKSGQGAFGLAAVVFCATAGCSTRPGGVDETLAKARVEVLSATGDCALASAKDFAADARVLEAATTAWASDPTTAKGDAARAAWRAAASRWAEHEGMMVGPALPSTQPGGADLRDHIYSWPLVSRCAIEELLVSRGYEGGVGGQLINRRGLYALEVLVFDEGSTTACGAASVIVSSGSWAAITTDERNARRRAYAAQVAADVVARADALAAAWEGGFLDTWKSAGPGNAVFPTAQKALNTVSDAALGVDALIINKNVSPPLGLDDLLCPAGPCPELLESGLAAQAKANIRANLRGFRNLTFGCQANHEGPGLDDLLAVKGANDVVTRLHERSDAAVATLEAIEEDDLALTLTADYPSLLAHLEALRALSNTLKTELLSTLDLELPKSLEGDND
jgi:uncharacterized protein